MSDDTKGPEMYGPPAPAMVPEAIPLRWVRVSHHSPDHIASRYPYAAYGSNLSLAQIGRRCPTAVEYGTGVLRDAKLAFAYYLGVVEAVGSSVPVAVFKVCAADVAALDRCEGLGRSYERFLVTIEVKGEAVRCFTYVKRDNALEEPSERYYQTCLQGYADFNFDARRLRHAKEDARKNGKRRTYSPTYGHWDSSTPAFDWDEYRKGTASTSTHTQGTTPDHTRSTTHYWDGFRWIRRTRKNNAVIPTVRSYDEAVGNDEPIGNGTAASYQPRTSLVTGRELPSSRHARRAQQREIENWKRKHGSGKYQGGPLDVDPERISTLNGENQEEFTNPKNGERWRKGKNGVWYRAKGE